MPVNPACVLCRNYEGKIFEYPETSGGQPGTPGHSGIGTGLTGGAEILFSAVGLA